MRSQFRKFAVSGIVAVALFALATLYVQFFDVLVREFFASRGVNLRRFNRSEYLDVITVGISIYALIILLGYCFLDMGFFSLSVFKKTRQTSNWGMTASRLGYILAMINLARFLLLGFGGQETGLRADFFTRGFPFFVIVQSVAFCVSFLFLQRAVIRIPFLRGACLVGGLGLFLFVLLTIADTFGFLHDLIFRHIGFRDYQAVYYGSCYLFEALLLLFFILLLFCRKDVSFLMDVGCEDTDECASGSPECRVDWSTCVMPLLVLFLIAVPLCVMPFCLRYPYFSKSPLYVSFQNNVLIFKSLCVLIGGLMAISVLRVLLPFFKRLNFGRIFRSTRVSLGKSRKSVPAPDQMSVAPKTADASARERLLEIRQLLDEGLITQAEYGQKRAEILSKL